MQYTPLQSEQMLVQTMPYCLHVQFFRAQSILQQLFLTALVVLLVWSFRSALFLVLLAVNPILRDPAHSSLSTLVSYDICKAHIAVHHLEWVQEVQLSWNVGVCLDIFSWYLCTRSSSRVFSLLPLSGRSRIFSPACNMSFLPDANEKILDRFRNY